MLVKGMNEKKKKGKEKKTQCWIEIINTRLKEMYLRLAYTKKRNQALLKESWGKRKR